MSFDKAIVHRKEHRKERKDGSDKHVPSEFDCYMSDLHHSINKEKERCKSSLKEWTERKEE